MLMMLFQLVGVLIMFSRKPKPKKEIKKALKSNSGMIKDQTKKATKGNAQITESQNEALQEMERLSMFLQTQTMKRD